jgi:prepilin signal peptidase PulO-like enzyme (type II secretory pathway)
MFTEFLVYFFIFIFGVCIGSFLNCVIYRTELQENMPAGPGRKAVSFLRGKSFCPHCKHTLKWLDLVPVFSFVFLLGKCRYCKKQISVQYPLVELATGLIFLLISNQFQISNFLNLVFLFYVASVLIVIFVYDLKHYLIPDKVLFPAIMIAFIYRLFENFSSILFFLLASLIASGFFLAIFLISKGRWMGFGDVKLAVLMGLLLGVQNVLAALFLAFFFGAIIGVILMVFGKKKLKSEIPFGPFLIIGTFLAMLYGSQIIQWYLNFLQI